MVMLFFFQHMNTRLIENNEGMRVPLMHFRGTALHDSNMQNKRQMHFYTTNQRT